MPVRRPKLADHVGFIDQILDEDERVLRKQRHTAQRILERLRDERGYDGGYSTVRDDLRPRRQARREVFAPLQHPSGHAQADFGEAVTVLGGAEQKIRFFVMGLAQSDAIFVQAYHAETARARTADCRRGTIGEGAERAGGVATVANGRNRLPSDPLAGHLRG